MISPELSSSRVFDEDKRSSSGSTSRSVKLSGTVSVGWLSSDGVTRVIGGGSVGEAKKVW